jgi:hypothetical protein
MIKSIKSIVVILIALAAIFLIAFRFLIKEAFGPKYRQVSIILEDDRTLIGKETYNADMAAVFYDVDFYLKTNKAGVYNLGAGTFLDEDWSRHIKVYDLGDWIILPVRNGSYSKILITNKSSHLNIDTILSPQNLRYDKLWKEKYDEIPAWVYTGSSSIDSVVSDKLYVTYEYRIGDYEPYQFYSHTVEHKIDTATGRINSVTIFGRKEKE